MRDLGEWNTEVDLINLLAIDLLECFEAKQPTQNQISAMESFLVSVVCEGQFTFNAKLTKREKDCLYWAAQGKSIEETAKLLGIDKTTVETHRRNLKRKLHCQNIAHAVFEGMRYGVVCAQTHCNQSHSLEKNSV